MFLFFLSFSYAASLVRLNTLLAIWHLHMSCNFDSGNISNFETLKVSKQHKSSLAATSGLREPWPFRVWHEGATFFRPLNKPEEHWLLREFCEIPPLVALSPSVSLPSLSVFISSQSPGVLWLARSIDWSLLAWGAARFNNKTTFRRTRR